MLRTRTLGRALAMSRTSCIPWRADSDAARRSSVFAFNEFLRTTRSSLFSSPVSVHVLVGNEAADADSIVSALSYAFVHHQKQAQTLHVALLPITRSELVLRCDVSALFQELGVDTDALVFVDEFPWALHARVKVVEIVDHHSDLGHHLGAEREVAFADGNALVASTCTLVAERLKDVESHDVHQLLSTMLLGVIALDSINFDPSAKKVTPRDVKAAEKLEETAFADKEQLFKWLQAEKFNPTHWGAFTLENCLQVDYKEFTFATSAGDAKKVGMSAVLIDLETFVLKSADAADLRKRLSEYCKQNELAFLVVMTMFMTSDGQRHRQLLFYQENGDEAKHCVEFFTNEGSLHLESLKLPDSHHDRHVAAFNQLNTGASRKQVAPLIQRALAEPAVKL
ncbi:Exopolyphosphatase PRUNE1 [Phytophthora ramorum]|uniref:Exopolyphosphatase PRUNE1 n=1 Tax=Phytophthora ramorum TaxID=164328 RepID=UPI0030A6E37E|nr:Exopolyphosphatase PRUNE1 [Phytophthora ramorum]